jgi:hypothetical protein
MILPTEKEIQETESDTDPCEIEYPILCESPTREVDNQNSRKEREDSLEESDIDLIL